MISGMRTRPVMLTQGVHPKVVSERLGHASARHHLWTLYSHVLPTLQQEAADAFDDLFAAPARDLL